MSDICKKEGIPRRSIVIKPQLWQAVREAAARQGIGMSEYIRRAIQEKLAKEKEDEKK